MAIRLLSSENISGNITVSGSATIETDINLESGTLIIKNATGDSSGLKIFQDSSDASKIHNNYSGTLQLGVNNATTLTLDSSEATFGTIIYLPDGSATAPSIGNTGDVNTGMYWPGDHQLGFAINGSRKMYMSETKTFFQNQANGVEINNGLNVIGETETDTALVTDKLGIGAINNSFNLYNNGTTYLNGNTTVDATFTVSNTATTSSTSTVFLYGKRTNSTDGPIGEIIYSNNGDSVATLAGFRDGADDKGSLVFQTQNGSAGFATRLTIAAPGDATFTNNLTFPDAGLSSSASATNFGVYNSEIRLIDTPNGGLKQCRVITDNYGEWILVGRFAADARANIQSTWSSESGLDTSTSQSTTTKFSSDFGDSSPTEVRIMGATDFTKWRDTRTIDWIYGVPEGRAWKFFFSGGAENGMTSVGPNHSGNNKFGWNINGSYDGFGRWVNPAQTSVGMSDANVTNPSAAYTTATTNAFSWNGASDAKMTVTATRTNSGQDSFETAGFGADDNLQGFFDEYPNETNNMQGGVDFSSAVWVLIKLPTAISSGSGGGSGNQWAGGPTTIHNTNTGSVGIGTSNPGVTGKGLEIQNIGNDTTASLKLTGHNNTGTPGAATSTELKHIGDSLKFVINHAGTDALSIGSSASTIGFTLANTTELGTYPQGAVKRVRMTQGGEIHFGDTTAAAPLGITEGVWDNFGDQDSLGIYSRNHFSVYSYGGTYSNPKLRIDDAGSYFQGSNFGIGTTAPFSKLQIGNNTFSGNNGMHSDARVGVSNHGILTGMMLASTYNDAAHPEYGLVFVQGPSTSSYNVWSISPDGPAKGSSLVFNYQAQSTNIHSPANAKVVFQGSTGNVGIGTTSPSAKLEVRHPSYANTNETAIFTNGNLSGRIVYDTLVVSQTDVATISLVETPGTAAQEQKLTFSVGDNKAVIRTANTSSGMYFNVQASLTAPGYQATSGLTGIHIKNNGDVIMSAGNVGIGTTLPNHKLEVAGRTYIEFQGTNWNETTPGQGLGSIHLDPTGSGADNTGNAITFGASDHANGTVADAGIYTRSDGAYGTKMYFATTDSYAVGSQTRMMIDFNGNVGIGTTSPERILHLDANEGRPIIQLDKGGDKIISMGTGSSATNADDTIFQMFNEGSELVRIFTEGDSYFNGGNVGINITNPGQKLTVQGDGSGTSDVVRIIHGNGSHTGNGLNVRSANTGKAIFVDGSVGGGFAEITTAYNANPNIRTSGDVVAYASSDKRFKDNLEVIQNPIDKIHKLNGYTFDWNDKQDVYKGKDYGVVAQEVENVMPELVDTRFDGYKAVKYEKLVPLLIESIKELKAEIELLKKK